MSRHYPIGSVMRLLFSDNQIVTYTCGCDVTSRTDVKVTHSFFLIKFLQKILSKDYFRKGEKK